MVHHSINNPLNVVFVWGDDCGFASLMSIIVHLTNGPILNNRTDRFLSTNTEIFKSYYSRTLPDSADYNNYKRVVFGRNPFCKIVSQYLTNYVLVNSLCSDKDCTLTFEEFINDRTNNHNCEKPDVVSFDTTWYNSIAVNNKPECVVLLPDSPFPDKMVFHDRATVQQIYKFCWRKNLFAQIEHLFYSNLTQTSENESIYPVPLYKMTPAQLRTVLRDSNFISTTSFYSEQIKVLVDILMLVELDFYKTRGIICNP